MEISSNQWQNSSIPRFLDIFTGYIGESLQQMPIENVEKFSVFLTSIFWRWFFTRLSSSDDISPAAKVKYFHKIENWPRETLFFTTPTLKTDKLQVTIDLDVELISFYEQPLLINVVQRNSTAYFTGDEFYNKLLKQIRDSCKHEGVEDIRTTEGLIEFWSILITNLSSEWWGNDPFLSNTFSLKQFVSLLERILKQFYESDESGVTSDEIFDTIIFLVRKKFPGWSMTSRELEKEEKKHLALKETPKPYERLSEKTMKQETFYHLSTMFDLYFVTPLSQYLLLLEPYYQEIGDFRQEVTEIATDPNGEPRFILAKPPASIRLTTFGRHLFSLVLS